MRGHPWITLAAASAVLAGGSSPEQRAVVPTVVPAAPPEGARITQLYTTSAQVGRGETALVCYGVENAKAVWLEPPRRELSRALGGPGRGGGAGRDGPGVLRRGECEGGVAGAAAARVVGGAGALRRRIAQGGYDIQADGAGCGRQDGDAGAEGEGWSAAGAPGERHGQRAGSEGRGPGEPVLH